MGIPIEIPGLNVLLPEVGEGRTVIVEGGADLTNTFLVRQLSRTALRLARPVTFVTSRDEGEVSESLNGDARAARDGGRAAQIVQTDEIEELAELAPAKGLLVVDSFSFLTLDLEAQKLARLLRRLHSTCRERGSTAALTTDRGMFDPRAEAIAIHLADGYLQFHIREGPDGAIRFLRVPKWTDGKVFDRNIYYDFDGKRLAIDLRSRVL